MKRAIAILCMVLPGLLVARGATVDVDSLRFMLNTDGTASVTECLYTSTPEIAIPATVSDGTTTYAVTAIGNQVFRQCTFITAVTLPQSITSIGNYAFEYCTLRSIALPEGLKTIGGYAFHDCDYLKEVTLPASLTSLGTYTFWYCDSIETVTFLGNNDVELLGESQFSMMKRLRNVRLPDGLTLVTRSMFYGCDSLKSIDLSNTQVTEMRPYAFYTAKTLKEVKLPVTLESIGDNAFHSCGNLETISYPGSEAVSPTGVVIPPAVTYIGFSAFPYCNSIKSVVFPAGLTSIDTYILQSCEGLQSVVFPANLTVIPGYACSNCTKLSHVTWPEKLETIGSSAFAGCPLETVVLPSTVKEIRDNAFYHVMMTTLTLNEGLEKIGSEAFRGCDRLRELTLPSTLKSLGERAFYYCDSLYTVTFPEDGSNLTFSGTNHFSNNPRLMKVALPRTGMTTLPNYMLCSCDRLRNIELPASLTSIGDYVFWECDSLQTLYVPDGVKSIGRGAFRSCRSLRYLRLPKGLESIGEDAITYVEKLQFLNLPSTVTTLGNYAIHTTATNSNTSFKSLGIMGTTMPQTSDHVFWQYQPQFTLLVPEGQETDYQESASWTPDITDNRIIKGYPAEKQTLTADLIHFVTLNGETYVTGSPEAAVVEWFEGMGNYRIYYTDANGHTTTDMPEGCGEYTLSVEFEEGPYYKAASFENVGTLKLQEIADEDFALLWDFYNKTYDRTGKKSTWTGNNWKLVEGRKESAVGIFGVKWHDGHVEEINFGRGSYIFNLNANETPLSLFQLPKVKKIEMVNVGLYGDISKKVEQLLAEGGTLSTTLEHLDLYNNKLEGNITTLAAALPALKTLDVSHNCFSTVYPALPEGLESVDIGNQSISDIVATVDMRDMTERGFFSTLPSVVFYNPATRSYATDISINVKSGTNLNTFTLNYNGDNDFNVTGNCTWKGASGDVATCSYTDAGSKTTTFNAHFLYDMGDVDFNGTVDVIDLQKSINYLFTGYTGAYCSYRYNFTAGDIKADDVINVLDIVRHVDILLAQESSNGEAGAKSAGGFPVTDDAAGDAEASLYQVGGKLMLRTTRPVAAIDMVTSPTELSAINPQSSANMTIASRTQSDGQTHLVIYSTSGKTLPVGESVVATGTGEGVITSATLVDNNAKAVTVTLNDPAATVTAVKAVSSTEEKTGSDAVFSIGGQRMNAKGSLPKGVYIINGEKKIK